MSQHILTALYSRPEDAADAAVRLEALGVSRDDISTISAEADTAPNWLIPTLTGAGIGLATAGPLGAIVGAVVGGSLPVGNTGEPRDRREGTFVGVRVDEAQVGAVRAILNERGSLSEGARSAAAVPETAVGIGELPAQSGHTGVASGSVSTPDPSTADTLTPADLAPNAPVAGLATIDAGPVVEKDPESAKREVTAIAPRPPTSTRD
jgi:hypothetical protein